MSDRDSQLDKVLMGAPIGIAAAAVAYGGGHWVLVAMLGLVAVLVTASAAIEAWKTGSAAYAVIGLSLVVVPVGFAGLIVADRESAPGTVAGRPDPVGLERTTGIGGTGEAQKSSSGVETDLISFAEVATILRTAKRGASVAAPTAEIRAAVDRVRAWETAGVREFSSTDPATGRPLLPAKRMETLAAAKKSFEDKLATNGRQAMLTHEEAAWAAYTLGANP